MPLIDRINIFINNKMLALRTLRNLQKYTVTLINNSGQGWSQTPTPIGLLKFISGNSPCSQYILNLPQTYPNNTPQTLGSQPDSGSLITWESQPQLIFTQPNTATIWHVSPALTNLNVFIYPNHPYANLYLGETFS
jgi:hypothetical protein